MLATTLTAARKRIAKSKKLNENDTKATLIEPILAALGWDGSILANATETSTPVPFAVKGWRLPPVDHPRLQRRMHGLHTPRSPHRAAGDRTRHG